MSAAPAALRGGAVRVVLETPEPALDGEWLVTELSNPVRDFVSRIDSVDRIQLNSAGKSVTQVDVIMPGRNLLRFYPGALVLAAGAGNAELLDRASGGNRTLMKAFGGQQQIRKSHKAVVEGDRNDLPPLTGVFTMGGLFIVSRLLGKNTIWLISDNRGPNVAFPEDWIKYDARWWLDRTMASLRELAPAYVSADRSDSAGVSTSLPKRRGAPPVSFLMKNVLKTRYG
jgi:hypothetical protein